MNKQRLLNGSNDGYNYQVDEKQQIRVSNTKSSNRIPIINISGIKIEYQNFKLKYAQIFQAISTRLEPTGKKMQNTDPKIKKRLTALYDINVEWEHF